MHRNFLSYLIRIYSVGRFKILSEKESILKIWSHSPDQCGEVNVVEILSTSERSRNYEKLPKGCIVKEKTVDNISLSA